MRQRSRRPRLGRGLGLLPLLVLGLAAGCQEQAPQRRIIMLALDGMDPRAVDLLMQEGRMPHFALLRDRGAYTPLQSMEPMLSPILWTTVATGKGPQEHGISHFVAAAPEDGSRRPVSSRMRRVKSLWNIFSESQRSVGVVGWWATWPAETVRGQIVSDHACYHFLFGQGRGTQGSTAGMTHPPALFQQIAPLIRRPADISFEEAQPFLTVDRDEFDKPFVFDNDIGHFKWALATSESYRRIAEQIWSQQSPDLLMAYFEATDTTAHLFGHLFRAEGLAGELLEQQKRYGRTVEEVYRYADELVGRFIDLMDERTTLIVLSDHGFDLGRLFEDPSRSRGMSRRVSEKFHSPLGILYLYGNGIRKGVPLDQAHLLDIAPTVLALAGIPAGRDMPGRILQGAFDSPAQLDRIASYETGIRNAPETAGDSQVDQAVLERLKSLGYISASAPGPDRNMATILFHQGRYEESLEAFQRLVEAHPQDAGLRTNLAGVLGTLGRYEEARLQLEEALKIDPLHIDALHNRGAILERLGQKEEAIRQYRTVLRYRPEYQPSKKALFTLTGSDQTDKPLTGKQRQAAILAGTAGRRARRGDYAKAMELLDKAEKIAPELALIQQYRSNVAYLMGDKEAAVKALQRGLELEPDNLLFQSNLRRLIEPQDK